MITWNERLEEFKATVIEYIKDAVDKQGDINVISEDKYQLIWIINRLDYGIVGPFTNKFYQLEDISLDNLVKWADQIQQNGKL